MNGIEGRVALVAGATGPIGIATAEALAAKGAWVAALYHKNRLAAEGLSDRLGDGCIAVQVDLLDPASMSAAVGAVESALGPVAILVNAAHVHIEPQSLMETSAEQLRGQFDSVLAHVALCQRVVPGMRAAQHGRIVYIAGALMARALPGFGSYGAAKAAATTLTRYLALEEGRHGILASIVAPGRVVDPGDPQDPSPEMAEAARQLFARMALPAFPTAAQIAEATLDLIETNSITGQILWITGGEPIWS